MGSVMNKTAAKPQENHPSDSNRIFLLEDHPMMRHGIKHLLENEPGFRICGEADNVQDALEKVLVLLPDLVIVDLTLEGHSGLEFIKEARRRLPDLNVLVYSMHEEHYYAERVLTAGGRGYLMKSGSPSLLVEAVNKVLSGAVYLSPEMNVRMLDRLSGRAVTSAFSPVDQLTDRELEVLGQIGRGRSSRDISNLLHMSVKTVETHRAHIRQKLHVQSRSELIQFAVRWVEGMSHE